MSIRCPPLYTLTGTVCYSDCPAGTIVSGSYVDACVSTVPCPLGTVDDVTGMTCTKVPPIGIEEKSGSCPTGYTEWVVDQCYIDCPPQFLENGTDCRKKIVVRRAADPWCSNFLYSVVGSECQVDWLVVFIVLGAIALFIWVVYMMSNSNKSGMVRIFQAGPKTGARTTVVEGGDTAVVDTIQT